MFVLQSSLLRRTNQRESAKRIAAFVRRLLNEGKVHDPNPIAFLFPSLKSVMVSKMRTALEEEGLQALSLFGVFISLCAACG